MKSLLIIAICMFIVAIYQSSLDDNETHSEALRVNKVSTFLNYVSAFDAYYLTNGNGSGEVTNKVLLPSWLPPDPSVRMYIENSRGYVFMPAGSGLLSDLMKKTDYSSLVGFSDTTYINTVSGKLDKPTFVPTGYIVYVR